MPNSNAIFASLSASDASALRPHLKSVHLESRRILFDVGDVIDSVYFPTSAVVSLVVGLSTGEMVEGAMVGKDSIVGVAAAMDSKLAFTQAIVQLPGDAFVCDASAFKGVAMQSERLLSLLFRHEQAVYAQAQQSTACMAAHDVRSRLCRWLLRARDLSGGDHLAFTQEFLAEMLGVRRTSVTFDAHALQQAGLIKYSRGKIQILNVDGLHEGACECYETVRSQYAKLLGRNRKAHDARSMSGVAHG
ncbi:Crp/Fnr family transcriptional regulator [Bradyrhizobium erythrophlei]|uniref:cAMP-binding domain of CRP or a regulatory subunit of cAMP-dependent protein kinases n=1 Tax=Bradyrhizobium erythrophlei TaxID=1437360 RepID=A0A1M5Y261_9BRAD|nr:Crp/Fnr family transcriptional regulator [Bradyrhizobium erythrophlei]SHI06175.1 cAMP-binding domain of CRP or a regulatory subunit of cAMP-dependent protein kinases [Bradyrhizobium erythrophlei]